MKIRVITVGGTIDKVYFDSLSTYEVGDPTVTQMFQNAHVNFEYIIDPILQKDSLQMTDEDRATVRERIEYAEESLILITHGTDTMTETGAALLGIEGKTIVMTGAMQPARFATSDATFNLGTAIGALQVCSPGVYIAMSGRVFTIGNVKKNREKGVFEPIEG